MGERGCGCVCCSGGGKNNALHTILPPYLFVVNCVMQGGGGGLGIVFVTGGNSKAEGCADYFGAPSTDAFLFFFSVWE